ncbi:glycosyl hydrolase family 8 [Escherichia coli]|nr:glycosyl hydrolase family 8 [Escherichia coli]
MNVLRSGIVTMLLLAAFSVQAACTWPAWEQFKKDYISQEGRVIDPSDARKITTSEGQVTVCSLPWRLTTVQLSIIFSTGRRTISLRVL